MTQRIRIGSKGQRSRIVLNVDKMVILVLNARLHLTTGKPNFPEGYQTDREI